MNPYNYPKAESQPNLQLKEAALDFWKAVGKPPISWLPATHPTTWLWYPTIRGKIIRFLEPAFNIP